MDELLPKQQPGFKENPAKDFACAAKYLGKVNAIYPKTGTLENTARLYQKACGFLDNTACSRLTVTSRGIALHGKEIQRNFELDRITFCASYRKIPKVIAFNYLTSITGPRRLECHAVLCCSVEETQEIVRVLMAAFRKEFKDASSSMNTSVNRDLAGFPKKPLTSDSNNNVGLANDDTAASIPKKIGALLDSLTKCMTVEG